MKLVERTRGEFAERQENYDFVIGEKESCSCFYEFTYCNGLKKIVIGLIHNYPNMSLEPQIEIKGNRLIVGNNETITIIDVETKQINEFAVLPVFNKFFVCDDRIIVMSELTIFCLLDNNIVWSLNGFEDMISFERLEGNKLIISTYEENKVISIDIITGQEE